MDNSTTQLPGDESPDSAQTQLPGEGTHLPSEGTCMPGEGTLRAVEGTPSPTSSDDGCICDGLVNVNEECIPSSSDCERCDNSDCDFIFQSSSAQDDAIDSIVPDSDRIENNNYMLESTFSVETHPVSINIVPNTSFHVGHRQRNIDEMFAQQTGQDEQLSNDESAFQEFDHILSEAQSRISPQTFQDLPTDRNIILSPIYNMFTIVLTFHSYYYDYYYY